MTNGRWLKRLVVSTVVAFSSFGFGQAPTIQNAPEKTSFSDWRFVERTTIASEYVMSFASPVETAYESNNRVELRTFVPEDSIGQSPVVLILHYLGAVDIRSERLLATELCRRGIAAAIMTLPFHLSRTPKGYRSGELAIRPDVIALRGMMTQAVLDVRRSIDFLTSRKEFDRSKIGVAGISLGSVIAASSFGVDHRIGYGAFMLGGGDLAKIIWNSSKVTSQRDELRQKGFDESKLRESLKSVEPLEYLATRRSGSSFVIGGRFDTVMPNDATEELITALPDAKSLWIDTGHYGGIFIQQRLLSLVAQFFSAEFRGEKFTVPDSIYAPTLRVGIRLNYRGEFGIGAGFDIWKPRGGAKTFTTIFVTPKGPELFVGNDIATGVSAGLTVSTKRVLPALIWSSVL